MGTPRIPGHYRGAQAGCLRSGGFGEVLSPELGMLLLRTPTRSIEPSHYSWTPRRAVTSTGRRNARRTLTRTPARSARKPPRGRSPPRSPPGRTGRVAIRWVVEHLADQYEEDLRREVLKFDEFPHVMMGDPGGDSGLVVRDGDRDHFRFRTCVALVPGPHAARAAPHARGSPWSSARWMNSFIGPLRNSSTAA